MDLPPNYKPNEGGGRLRGELRRLLDAATTAVPESEAARNRSWHCRARHTTSESDAVKLTRD